MSTDDESWNDETEIDPEVWVQALLAMTGDKDRKAELIILAVLNYLTGKARSN